MNSERTQADRDLDLSTGREIERKDAEISRLHDMCIRREEFIAQKHLWAEFSKWLAEPTDTGSVT